MKFILTLILLLFVFTVQGQQQTSTLKTSALETLHEFINLIEQRNYKEAYKYISPKFSKDIMTQEEFTDYFESINKYYGDYIQYAIYDNAIPDSLPEVKNSLSVFGSITFENVSCFISLQLEYIEGKSKINSFFIDINEITNLARFDTLAKDEIDLLKKKKFDKIYNSSQLLKRVQSIENFTTECEKFLGKNQNELEISDVEINVYGAKTYLNLSYKNDSLSSNMTLEYLETNDTISFYSIRFYFENDFYNSIPDESEFETSIYYDSIYQYSFEYPDNWMIFDSAGNVVLIEEMKEDMIFPSLVLISVEDSISLKETVKLHEKSLQEVNGIQDLQLKAKSDVKFKDHEALRYSYRGRIGIPLLFIEILYIEADDKIYCISTMCSIDQKILNETKIRSIEDSFVFQK
jgi:hypothetical protein